MKIWRSAAKLFGDGMMWFFALPLWKMMNFVNGKDDITHINILLIYIMENNPFMFQTTNQLWFMLEPNKTGGFLHQRNHIGHHLGQVATKNCIPDPSIYHQYTIPGLVNWKKVCELEHGHLVRWFTQL